MAPPAASPPCGASCLRLTVRAPSLSIALSGVRSWPLMGEARAFCSISHARAAPGAIAEPSRKSSCLPLASALNMSWALPFGHGSGPLKMPHVSKIAWRSRWRTHLATLLPSKPKATLSCGHCLGAASRLWALACSSARAVLPRAPSRYPSELVRSKHGILVRGFAFAPPPPQEQLRPWAKAQSPLMCATDAFCRAESTGRPPPLLLGTRVGLRDLREDQECR